MPSTKPFRVLMAGGGTGGHVIPALAIARELRDAHGAEVRFVGTARGLETRLVPEAGFPLELVQSGQLKNVSLATRLRTLLDLPLGVLSCLRLLRSFRPDVVIGVGGYASGPGMLAAVLLRVPTMVFEPNAVPGLANRVVGRWVSAAAVNFEQTKYYFRNAETTGVPVRSAFFAIPPLLPSPHLLVFGGSQGARALNETMPKAARQLLERVPGLTILHQSGARHAEETERAYRASGADPARWRVAAFLDDMPQQFAEATLILCRSGASTVAELTAAGRPSVLVPFAGAADDHQRKNAEVLQQAEAAILRDEEANRDVFAGSLLSDLSVLNLPDVLARMGRNAKALAKPDALQRIAAIAVALAKPS